MDLNRPDPTLTVHAVQGEAYSRSLQITLHREHELWQIPEDVTVTVRYAKPDRTKGCYDTLPDGTSAWTAQGNLLTVHLAPQMLTVPGSVKAQVQLIQGSRILSTFALTLFVEADPAAGTMRSENYINWLQWIENQAQDQVKLTQQAANTACQAAQSATLAAEKAANSSNQAASFADNANTTAAQARAAADDAAAARKDVEDIAAAISTIVAGNEAYTKEESDVRYSPAIVNTSTGSKLLLTDSLRQKIQALRLFGKTTQNGIPTPEDPVGMVSSGSGGSITVAVSASEEDTVPQILTLLTPNGLPGIPVSSGGNYTDENGQQWICDEVDFERGIYVQRVGKTDFSQLIFMVSPDSGGYPAGESLFFQAYLKNPLNNWVTQYRFGMCSKLPFTRSALNQDINGFYCLGARVYCRIQGVSDVDTFNALMEGAEFLVPLEPATETSLPAEVMAAFAALYTLTPNTAITNDSSVGMAVAYTADTKRYIDNKLSALI